MRALVIAPQPFFTPRGTPFSVYYRTLIEAELGVEIDLLTYGVGRDPDIRGVRIVRIPRFSWLGEVRVGPSVLKLFLDGVLVMWMLVLLARRRYDFVHAHEEAVFFCRFVKPLFGFKLVYDMHSSLPQQLTNFAFTRSKLLIGAFRWLENSSLGAADAVITICPELARYAVDNLDDSSKHFLIENSLLEPVRLVGDPPGEEARAEPASVQTAAGSRAGRRVVYAGTLEPYQGIDLLIRSFRQALDRVPDAVLLVVGGSPTQVKHYRGLAEELGIAANTEFTGMVAPRVARQYSAGADLLVSPRTEGTNTPLKIYEQLASGIPMVATDIRSHTQVLDSRVAFLGKPEPGDFSRALVDGLTARDVGRVKAEGARALFETRYSRAAYLAKMRALLERIG